MKRRIIVGITGASGIVYALNLLRALIRQPLEVHLIMTRDGRKVAAHEMEREGRMAAILEAHFGAERHPQARLVEHEADNYFAAPASGSFRHDGMVVLPCSMKTLAARPEATAARVFMEQGRTTIPSWRNDPLAGAAK